jgi:hypothetical protein
VPTKVRLGRPGSDGEGRRHLRFSRSLKRGRGLFDAIWALGTVPTRPPHVRVSQIDIPAVDFFPKPKPEIAHPSPNYQPTTHPVCDETPPNPSEIGLCRSVASKQSDRLPTRRLPEAASRPLWLSWVPAAQVWPKEPFGDEPSLAWA